MSDTVNQALAALYDDAPAPVPDPVNPVNPVNPVQEEPTPEPADPVQPAPTTPEPTTDAIQIGRTTYTRDNLPPPDVLYDELRRRAAQSASDRTAAITAATQPLAEQITALSQKLEQLTQTPAPAQTQPPAQEPPAQPVPTIDAAIDAVTNAMDNMDAPAMRAGLRDLLATATAPLNEEIARLRNQAQPAPVNPVNPVPNTPAPPAQPPADLTPEAIEQNLYAAAEQYIPNDPRAATLGITPSRLAAEVEAAIAGLITAGAITDRAAVAGREANIFQDVINNIVYDMARRAPQAPAPRQTPPRVDLEFTQNQQPPSDVVSAALQAIGR